MRLINISTRRIQEFAGDRIPRYAILSHTWGDGEVSFQEYDPNRAYSQIDELTPGYDKIDGCCKAAALDDIEWVWIDTCCIDKRSSAELSEAINSMFSWYRNAVICYAYLVDVEYTPAVQVRTTLRPFHTKDKLQKEHKAQIKEQLRKYREEGRQFRESRWFTRGWTLQELIAPSVLVFLSRDWRRFLILEEPATANVNVGIDDRRPLAYVLNEITGILPECFSTPEEYLSTSIATRLSWASRRQTTRLEDTAYCLMGLVGINMPLLYGEGERAFRRLQEEIIRTKHDQTLFCWGTEHGDGRWSFTLENSKKNVKSTASNFHNLLAHSPADFMHWRHDLKPIQGESHYLTTNFGLLIDLPIRAFTTAIPLPFTDPEEQPFESTEERCEDALGILDVCISDPERPNEQRHFVALPLHFLNNSQRRRAMRTGAQPFLVPAEFVETATRQSIYIDYSPAVMRSSIYGVNILEGSPKIRFRCADIVSKGYSFATSFPWAPVEVEHESGDFRIQLTSMDLYVQFIDRDGGSYLICLISHGDCGWQIELCKDLHGCSLWRQIMLFHLSIGSGYTGFSLSAFMRNTKWKSLIMECLFGVEGCPGTDYYTVSITNQDLAGIRALERPAG